MASRSDGDPRVRPLKPTVGGGQISGAYRLRTGGPDLYAESPGFLKRKAHLIVVAFIGGGLAGARTPGPYRLAELVKFKIRANRSSCSGRALPEASASIGDAVAAARA
jgi:hypothetical protein